GVARFERDLARFEVAAGPLEERLDLGRVARAAVAVDGRVVVERRLVGLRGLGVVAGLAVALAGPPEVAGLCEERRRLVRVPAAVVGQLGRLLDAAGPGGSGGGLGCV